MTEDNISKVNSYSLVNYNTGELNDKPKEYSLGNSTIISNRHIGIGDNIGINYDRSKYDPANVYKYNLGNLEDIRSQNQGVFDSLGRSTANLIGKTGINVAGGIAGSIYGIGSAIANGDITKIWDNSLTTSLDAASEAVGDYFKVYKSAGYNEKTLLGRMFLHPIQFADEFMDTLSFTTGAIVTELITAGLASGFVVPRAMKYLRNIDKAGKATDVAASMARSNAGLLSRLGDAGTLSRQLATGAAWEASVEARHGAIELRNKMELDWLEEARKSNPFISLEDMPEDVRNDISDRAANAGLFTFLSNMALVGGSNMVQFPKIFGASYNTNKRAISNIAGRVSTDIDGKFIDTALPTSRAERIRRNIFTAAKNPFMEGIVEEGGQGVISETALSYFDRKNDIDGENNVARFIHDFAMSLKDTYTTGEGWYEIGMGMLIGSLGSPGRGMLSIFGKDNKLGKEGFNEDGSIRELWTGGIAGAFQERSSEDARIRELVEELNNQPSLMDAMKSHYDFLVRTNSYQKDMDIAAEEGDIYTYENMRDDMLFSFINTRMNAGLGSTLEYLIEDINNTSAEDLYKEFRGEEALNNATQEDINNFKRKQVNTLTNKIKEVREATKIVDNALQNINEDLRNELIYNASSAKFIDIREELINQDLFELSGGTISHAGLVGVEDVTLEDFSKSLKEEQSNLDKESSRYSEIDDTLKFISVLNKKERQLSANELEILRNFSVSNPVEFGTNVDYVVDLLIDSKKLRARRQNFINNYNLLFSKKGQEAFKEYQEKVRADMEKARQDEINRREKIKKDREVKNRQKEIEKKANKLKEKESSKTGEETVNETSVETDSRVPKTVEVNGKNYEVSPDGIITDPETGREIKPNTKLHQSILDILNEVPTEEGSIEESDNSLTDDEAVIADMLEYDKNKAEIDLQLQDGNVNNGSADFDAEQVQQVFDPSDMRVEGNTIISLNIEYIETPSSPVKSIKDRFDDEGNLVINENFDSRLQDPNQFNAGTEVEIIIPTYQQMMNSGMRADYTINDYNADILDPKKLPIAFVDNAGKIIGYLPTTSNVSKRVAPKYLKEEVAKNIRTRELIFNNQDKLVTFKITSKSPGTPMYSKRPKSIYEGLGDGRGLANGVKIGVAKQGTLMVGQGTPFKGKVKLPLDLTLEEYLENGVVYSVTPTADGQSHHAIPLKVNKVSPDSANTVVHMLKLFLANPKNKNHKALIDNRKAVSHEVDFSNFKSFMEAVENIMYINNTNERYRFDIDLKNRVLRTGIGKNQKYDLNELMTNQKEVDRLVADLGDRFYSVKLQNFGNNIPVFTVENGQLTVESTNYYDFLNNNNILTTNLQNETIEGTNNKYFTAQSVITLSKPLFRDIKPEPAVAVEATPEATETPTNEVREGVITKSTDFGNIYYIKDSNGDLIKISEEEAKRPISPVEKSKILQEKVAELDLPLGKISNTQYEVKSDGVYYQDKKLNNPNNSPARELVEADIKRRWQKELNEQGRVWIVGSLINAKDDRDSNPKTIFKGMSDVEMEELYQQELKSINEHIEALKRKGIDSDKIAKSVNNKISNTKILRFRNGAAGGFIAETVESLSEGGIKSSAEIDTKYGAELAELNKQQPSQSQQQSATNQQIADIERRRAEVREIFKENPILALHIIKKEKQLGSYDDYGRPNGSIQDIVTVLKVTVSEAQELQQDYLKAGKPEGWKFGDNYDYSKYDAELEKLKSAITKVSSTQLQDSSGDNVDKTTPAKKVFKNPFGARVPTSRDIGNNIVEDFAVISNNTFNILLQQIPKGRETEEFVASEKTIRDLAARMSDRIGIPVRFESDRSKNYKGKLEDGVAVVNLAYATLDTPIHEILGHPIIRVIKGTNNPIKWTDIFVGKNKDFDGYYVSYTNAETGVKEEIFTFEDRASALEYKQNLEKENSNYSGNKQLYQNLLKELEYGKGKEVLDRIKRDYVEKPRLNIQNRKQYTYNNITINGIENSGFNNLTFKFDNKEYYITRNGSLMEITSEGAVNVESISEDLKNKAQEAYNTALDIIKNGVPQDNYTLEEQQEEAIVELLGLYTADRLDKAKDGKLISLLKRLLKEIKAFMRSLINQKEVNIDKLPDNMTLGDIADLLAYSNSKLILPGNEVVYTTPDNQQFKTYTEASKHISELAKSVEEVDLSRITLKDKNKVNKIEEILVDSFSGVFEDFIKIDGKWYNQVTYNPNHDYSKDTPVSDREIIAQWNARFDDVSEYGVAKGGLEGFIEKNKEYEQSKEIIEGWKKVNNIQYNPEEVYSRGQEFVSVVGAYSDFDVNLMMQNLLQHIEDNKRAGGEFTISTFTKPIDRQIGHLEGGGGKIKFKIYPQSNDIKWAANTDVYSGSVWDASEKVNKDKKSELLGVSYTKYPSLRNVNSVQPNLASIIDNLDHHHNELGIALNGNNFRLEYDADIPYSTKKIINSINSILDQKYGKLVKPEIRTKNRKSYYTIERTSGMLDSDFRGEYSKEEVFNKIQELEKQYPGNKYRAIEHTKFGTEPTQTNETLKESIDSIQSKIVKFDGKNIAGLPKDKYPNQKIGDIVEYQGEQFKITGEIEEDVFFPASWKVKPIKEYTEQALINTKIATLKEVAKKYPRSLIRSEVRPINPVEQSNRDTGLDMFEDELPFQKIPQTFEEKSLESTNNMGVDSNISSLDIEALNLMNKCR